MYQPEKQRFQSKTESYEYLLGLLDRWETFFKAHDKLADAIIDVLNWNSSYRADIEVLTDELKKKNR